MADKKGIRRVPSMEEIIKNHPPSQEKINIHYADEDEEEELDTTFEMPDWEKEFYDEDGNFLPNGKEDK